MPPPHRLILEKSSFIFGNIDKPSAGTTGSEPVTRKEIDEDGQERLYTYQFKLSISQSSKLLRRLKAHFLDTENLREFIIGNILRELCRKRGDQHLPPEISLVLDEHGVVSIASKYLIGDKVRTLDEFAREIGVPLSGTEHVKLVAGDQISGHCIGIDHSSIAPIKKSIAQALADSITVGHDFDVNPGNVIIVTIKGQSIAVSRDFDVNPGNLNMVTSEDQSFAVRIDFGHGLLDLAIALTMFGGGFTHPENLVLDYLNRETIAGLNEKGQEPKLWRDNEGMVLTHVFADALKKSSHSSENISNAVEMVKAVLVELVTRLKTDGHLSSIALIARSLEQIRREIITDPHHIEEEDLNQASAIDVIASTCEKIKELLVASSKNALIVSQLLKTQVIIDEMIRENKSDQEIFTFLSAHHATPNFNLSAAKQWVKTHANFPAFYGTLKGYLRNYRKQLAAINHVIISKNMEPTLEWGVGKFEKIHRNPIYFQAQELDALVPFFPKEEKISIENLLLFFSSENCYFNNQRLFENYSLENLSIDDKKAILFQKLANMGLQNIEEIAEQLSKIFSLNLSNVFFSYLISKISNQDTKVLLLTQSNQGNEGFINITYIPSHTRSNVSYLFKITALSNKLKIKDLQGSLKEVESPMYVLHEFSLAIYLTREQEFESLLKLDSLTIFTTAQISKNIRQTNSLNDISLEPLFSSLATSQSVVTDRSFFKSLREYSSIWSVMLALKKSAENIIKDERELKIIKQGFDLRFNKTTLELCFKNKYTIDIFFNEVPGLNPQFWTNNFRLIIHTILHAAFIKSKFTEIFNGNKEKFIDTANQFLLYFSEKNKNFLRALATTPGVYKASKRLMEDAFHIEMAEKKYDIFVMLFWFGNLYQENIIIRNSPPEIVAMENQIESVKKQLDINHRFHEEIEKIAGDKEIMKSILNPILKTQHPLNKEHLTNLCHFITNLSSQARPIPENFKLIFDKRTKNSLKILLFSYSQANAATQWDSLIHFIHNKENYNFLIDGNLSSGRTEDLFKGALSSFLTHIIQQNQWTKETDKKVQKITAHFEKFNETHLKAGAHSYLLLFIGLLEWVGAEQNKQYSPIYLDLLILVIYTATYISKQNQHSNNNIITYQDPLTPVPRNPIPLQLQKHIENNNNNTTVKKQAAPSAKLNTHIVPTRPQPISPTPQLDLRSFPQKFQYIAPMQSQKVVVNNNNHTIMQKQGTPSAKPNPNVMPTHQRPLPPTPLSNLRSLPPVLPPKPRPLTSTPHLNIRSLPQKPRNPFLPQASGVNNNNNNTTVERQGPPAKPAPKRPTALNESSIVTMIKHSGGSPVHAPGNLPPTPPRKPL